ncbi:hypothetical protein AB0756_04345 [Tolypothrix campylonemoides VB511288_2]|uniref:Uncharacterized protein n=5 Tax=Cyanophyceae TaxID=3028117 RepID=A0A8S9TBT9_9CYAN|nr:hypothetical protein [Tolypothrix bouteillei]KAF3889875.1 hypothetical protein DA73_0400033710 [Tolypothrix bouteillei VB521301]
MLLTEEKVYQVADVIPYIYQLKEEFEKSRLVQYMQQETTPVEERLNFAPYFAYFANSFSDLSAYIIPYENPDTDLKKKINQHTKEDMCHNGLFLQDMQLFEEKFHDFTFTKCLEFLWDEKIKHSRILSFGITKLTYLASEPSLRYCLIRIIEELGNTFFQISHKCKIGERESKYFGHIHLGYEPGHLHVEDEKLFESQKLTSEQYELAKQIVRECFTLFFNMMEEIYERTLERKFC